MSVSNVLDSGQQSIVLDDTNIDAFRRILFFLIKGKITFDNSFSLTDLIKCWIKFLIEDQDPIVTIIEEADYLEGMDKKDLVDLVIYVHGLSDFQLMDHLLNAIIPLTYTTYSASLKDFYREVSSKNFASLRKKLKARCNHLTLNDIEKITAFNLEHRPAILARPIEKVFLKKIRNEGKTTFSYKFKFDYGLHTNDREQIVEYFREQYGKLFRISGYSLYHRNSAYIEFEAKKTY